MKIVYCLDNLYDLGGIARITLVKANALSEIEGNEVYLCVLDSKKISQLPINNNVHVISLEINYADGWSNRLLMHLYNVVLKCTHFFTLHQSLKRIQPDVVITTGQKGCHLLQWLPVKSEPMKIREYHFTRNFMDFQCHSRLSLMKNKLEKLYDRVTCFYGYDKIVVLTQEDKILNWEGNDKVVVIPNPITAKYNKLSTCNNKVMIAAGRLHEQKNFASMIRVWQHVYEQHPDWYLHIYGEGWLRGNLEEQIRNSKYPNSVILMGKTDKMLEKMGEASTYIMTSEFEGLPLVLLEAMSVGLPVVSYSCPCGPKDIVDDGVDGFLLPVHDEVSMAQKLCWLIDHDEERKLFGNKAYIKSGQYQVDSIISIWMSLFNSRK